MKRTRRVWLCRGLVLGVLALGLGCEDRVTTEQESKLRRSKDKVRAFEKQLAQMASKVPKQPGSCPDGAIRAAIAKSQNRRVLFVDVKSLTAAARGKLSAADSPLGFLVTPAFSKRTGSADMLDDKSATDAEFALVTLKKQYDFLATVDFSFKAPKADGEGFHAGELRGTLALFDFESGKALCSAPVSAESSLEAVKKPGQSRQQAADKDLQMQIRRALEQAFAQMTQEVVLDLG